MSTEAHHPQESIAVESLSELTAVVEELRTELQEERQRRKELEDRVEELEDEQNDHQEQTARERAADRQRITDVEDRLDDVEQTDNTQSSTGENTTADSHTQPQTALEQTVSLPQEMIDDETANVRRAVFVAQDVTDYSRQVPAGRAIKSSELRHVLRAGTDANGHNQTVDRVMAILDEMGGDEVDVVDRRGERRVVFTEELCRRLEAVRQDHQEDNHGVVTGGTA